MNPQCLFLYRCFSRTAAAALILTGSAKLISLLVHPEVLEAVDPILPLPERYVFLGVGLLEVWLAFRLWQSQQPFPEVVPLLGFSLAAIGYRWLLHHVDGLQPCPCLGIVTNWIHLSAPVISVLLWTLLIYWCAGSCYFLALAAGRRRDLRPAGRPGVPAGSVSA